MEIELIQGKDTFTIQVKDKPEHKLYEAAIADLNETRTENDVVYSDWILHLKKKVWITSEVLYELAQLIKKRYPKISIDWFETFYDVEKYLYQKNVSATRRITGKSKKVDFHSLLKLLKINREDTLDEEIEQDLRDIVNLNLINYELI